MFFSFVEKEGQSDQISKKHVPCKAAPSKAQKGKKKRATSVIESDAADSDHESSSSSSSEEETSSDESKSLGSGEDNEPSHLLSSSGTMCSTRHTTMDANYLDWPEEHICSCHGND